MKQVLKQVVLAVVVAVLAQVALAQEVHVIDEVTLVACEANDTHYVNLGTNEAVLFKVMLCTDNALAEAQSATVVVEVSRNADDFSLRAYVDSGQNASLHFSQSEYYPKP